MYVVCCLLFFVSACNSVLGINFMNETDGSDRREVGGGEGG